jgi:hypothetical protein
MPDGRMSPTAKPGASRGAAGSITKLDAWRSSSDRAKVVASFIDIHCGEVVGCRRTYHEDATRFWYAGGAVAILTLASIPHLRMGDKTRPARSRPRRRPCDI